MDHLVYVGAVSLVVGLAMTAFSKTLGRWFCRLGKSAWKDANIPAVAKDYVNRSVDRIYDEKNAPRTMRILGLVFAAQGIGFICVGIWA